MSATWPGGLLRLRRRAAAGFAARQYRVTQYLFLKLLALVYVIAFTSTAVQVRALVGEHGILPLTTYLQRAHEVLGRQAYWSIPGVFWFASGDSALLAVCVLGALCGVLVLANRAVRPALAGAFLLYLSLVSAGQDFLSFQWDFLLLEAGFLAIFLGLSRGVVFLYWWLLFRLMLLSGWVKYASGDPAWRSLTALSYHYETQPLPTPIAWYVHQLPAWFHSASTAAMFVIELMAPLLIFGPRRLRFIAAGAIAGLQCLILLTGNYTFFNVLTIALCIFVFDDDALRRVLPERVFRIASLDPSHGPSSRPARAVVTVVAALILLISTLQLSGTILGYSPGPGLALIRLVSPFGIVNTYGLFAVMTTTRLEIIVEGSNDGAHWEEYEFKYKPGDVRRAPPWVAPYQPRLDWQMWFAALGSYRDNPWFVNFVVRLLQGSAGVKGLLARIPLGGRAPEYIRATVYRYRFTSFSERRATGAWWSRDWKGIYLPPVSLRDIAVNARIRGPLAGPGATLDADPGLHAAVFK
jgi:hypothetical protein